MQLFTQEKVRSTFKEDAFAAMEALMGKVANIEQDASYDPDFKEFPVRRGYPPHRRWLVGRHGLSHLDE